MCTQSTRRMSKNTVIVEKKTEVLRYEPKNSVFSVCPSDRR